MVSLGFLACVLMATTKKVVNFLDEKSAPPEKILATPMEDITEMEYENIIIIIIYSFINKDTV